MSERQVKREMNCPAYGVEFVGAQFHNSSLKGAIPRRVLVSGATVMLVRRSRTLCRVRIRTGRVPAGAGSCAHQVSPRRGFAISGTLPVAEIFFLPDNPGKL